jgi:putative ABC transport system permease protein
MALSNLWRRKMRTALTILAVVIGATLVALMVSIGSGLQGFIVNQFGMQVSPDAIYVSSGERVFERLQQGNSGPVEITDTQAVDIQPFTAADLEKIRAIPGVAQVDYRITVDASYIQPADSGKKYTIQVSPVPAYDAAQRPLFIGQYFSDEATDQCLLSYNYLEAFGWSQSEAIGKQVNIVVGKANPYNQDTQSFTFTVVGVTDKSVSSTDEVLIPNAAGADMARFYQDNPLLYSEQQPGYLLQVKVTGESQVDSVASAIKGLGFSAITPAQILEQINSVFNIIQIGLGAFGGIALVVAAIGIINTLMMAIYERTREIGVMKAVGATRGTIRLLFTAEGGALGLFGGVIGVLLAMLLGQALNFIGARTFLADYPGFNMSTFSVGLVLGVIALTTVISLVAGLYPAARAARLDPVEALRYE